MKVVKWAVEKAFSDKLISNKFSRLQPKDEKEVKKKKKERKEQN